MTAPRSPRLGRLMRDRELVTEDELAEAVRAHEESGRPLGEVVTDMLGLLTIAEMRDLLLLQRRWRPLGQLLLERGLLTEDQLLTALDEQRRTGRPLGEIVGRLYRLSSITLDKLLSEQRELELELDRGYGSGLRNALQRGARVQTTIAGGDAPISRASALAERLSSPAPDPRTHLALQQVEAGEKKVESMNALLLRQREELGLLRDALADRHMVVIELEERVAELEELLAERTASTGSA